MMWKILVLIYQMCLLGQGLCSASNMSMVYANDSLLSELVNLHELYCADFALCSNRSHREPSPHLFPVPCCVPCSCLPQCVEKGNCCPDFWEKSSENNTDRSTDIGKSSAQSKYETTSPGNVLNVETKEKASINAECIRPQVFYEPNIHPDVIGNVMVTSCPGSFQDKAVIKKCQAGVNNEDLADSVPVTSELNGETYVNKYCLLCNEPRQFYRKEVHQWQTLLVSYRQSTNYGIYYLTTKTFVKMANHHFTNIVFMPRNPNLIKPCKEYDISSCNQTGLWDVYDKQMHNICEYGHSLPIIHRLNDKRMLFKNIACVKCNAAIDISGQTHHCSYPQNYVGQALYYYSLSLNVASQESKRWEPDLSQEDDRRVMQYLKQDLLRQLKSGPCAPGFADLLGRCREIICPRHHYFKNNRCIPLYSVITGLDLNIKLEITPNQTIPRRLSSELVDKLRSMVNFTLKHTISLQLREATVWHKPKSNNNPVEYYLFLIYLHNATEIRYSKAVLEIKEFFDKVKKQRTLTLTSGFPIGLEFKFNKRIDANKPILKDPIVNGGGTLRPANGNDGQRSQPEAYMTISNVNWCFRTGVFSDEVQYVGDKIFKVKSTDIHVYADQYDFDPLGNNTEFYLCIDLFVSTSDTVSTQNIQVYTNDGPGNKVSVESTSMLDKRIAVTFALFAICLLGIVVYKVKTKVKNREVRNMHAFVGEGQTDHQHSIQEEVSVLFRNKETQDAYENTKKPGADNVTFWITDDSSRSDIDLDLSRVLKYPSWTVKNPTAIEDGRTRSDNGPAGMRAISSRADKDHAEIGLDPSGTYKDCKWIVECPSRIDKTPYGIEEVPARAKNGPAGNEDIPSRADRNYAETVVDPSKADKELSEIGEDLSVADNSRSGILEVASMTETDPAIIEETDRDPAGITDDHFIADEGPTEVEEIPARANNDPGEIEEALSRADKNHAQIEVDPSWTDKELDGIVEDLSRAENISAGIMEVASRTNKESARIGEKSHLTDKDSVGIPEVPSSTDKDPTWIEEHHKKDDKKPVGIIQVPSRADNDHAKIEVDQFMADKDSIWTAEDHF